MDCIALWKRHMSLGVISLVIPVCTDFSGIDVNTCHKSIKSSDNNKGFIDNIAASLLTAMDSTVAPCVDFFQYACGTWNRLHVIPEDRSSISTFEVLADQLQVILKRLLEEPPNANDNNATLKAKMFYRSCMDIRGYKWYTGCSLEKKRIIEISLSPSFNYRIFDEFKFLFRSKNIWKDICESKYLKYLKSFLSCKLTTWIVRIKEIMCASHILQKRNDIKTQLAYVRSEMPHWRRSWSVSVAGRQW